MGAKIGRRVYWPGSGLYCSDPELLEIGDDVVFGSRSVLITTDRLGTGKIVIENGGEVFCSHLLDDQLIVYISMEAMIADRVVLLPGTRVGTRAIMGSGALGRRNGTYAAGSTWIGNGGSFPSHAMLVLFTFNLRKRRSDLSEHGIRRISHRI